MTSAYGKVILFGEHAVVYGHTAVAVAIDRVVTCEVRTTPGRANRLIAPDWNLDVSTASPDHPVARALAVVCHELGANDTGHELVVASDLPAGAGLGSSAALSVAMTRAIAADLAAALDDSDVERIANRAECVFHATPSGIDVALACRGGAGSFTREGGLRPLACPPFSIAVGLSGEPRNTADMVALVADRRTTSDHVERALGQLGVLAAQAAPLLTAGTIEDIGPLMTQAHLHLATVGVSTDRLDRLVDVAMSSGAAGAKLTGAGGGGAVIAVATDPEVIRNAWTEAGFDAFMCCAGGRR